MYPKKRQVLFSKAVLVAIAIPVFTSQLEKSREATDLSNIRAAYAEVMSAALTNDTSPDDTSITYNASTKTWSKSVTLKQSANGWATDVSQMEVGGVNISSTNPTAGGTCTVNYNETDGATYTFS